jgi:hypothetical protein
MASKPNNASPQYPYIVVPIAQGVVHTAEATPFKDRGDAVFKAQEWAETGHEAVIYEATNVYGKVSRVDVIWSSRG